MLLPQSSAFAALKNRLNSVSSIGYLHIAPRPYVASISSVFVSLSKPSSHSRQGSLAEGSKSPLILSSPPPRSSSRDAAGLVPPSCSSYTTAHTSFLFLSSNATTPSAPSFDRPNRLKGRDEGIIRWNELLEKFRTVQDRARRAQRGGGVNDMDDVASISDLRAGADGGLDGNGAASRSGPGNANHGGASGGPRGPPVPSKDPPAPAAKPRSGLGRPFGRLGATVSGRGKRAQ